MTLMTTRVTEIVEHERLADELAAQSEEHRWRAAELIHAELAADPEMTQRQLASLIGKNQSHVCFMNRVWQRVLDYPGNRNLPFAEAYKQAKLTEAQVADEARRTAVSYETVIYRTALLQLQLFRGDGPARIAQHMRDYPELTAGLTSEDFTELATAFADLGAS